MKKILNLCLIAIFSLLLFSCAKEKKTAEKTSAETFMVDGANSTVQWTGYKTTDKVAVNGTFEEIKILKMASGTTAPNSIEGLEFEIPVASIY